MIGHKLKRAYEFLSLLTVEPFIFVFFFVYTLKSVPTDQLVQDKICLHVFNMTSDYCHHLPLMSDEDDYLNKKSDILAAGTTYKLIAVIFLAVPSFVAAFFVGSWADKYLKAKKFLLIFGAFTSICESLVLILNVYFFSSSHYFVILSLIPPAFSGGMLSLLTCFWTYFGTTTPPKLRAIRMAAYEVLICIAKPLGTYLGGLILNTPSILNGGQIHNYLVVYIICGIAYFLILIWTVLMVDEKRDVEQFEKRFNSSDTENNTKVSDKLKRFEKYEGIHPIKLLFNSDNVKDMFKTLKKKRDGSLRLQIWLLMISLACYLLSHVGPIIFLYPFAQKIYKWNSETYSNITAIQSVVNAGATLLLASILIKVLKLKDMTISTIGLLSYFAQNMICGLVLTEMGFYISIPAGCLGPIASIGIRSYFSKIIPTKELGKVFSLLSAIESFTPLIAAAFFSQIFNHTMDSMPGLSFILTALLLVIPLVVANWIRFFTRSPKLQETKDSTNDLVNDNTTNI